jgi:hypothetical protein
MGPVDSVKIAHADQSGPEVRGNVFEFVKHLHKSNSIAEIAESAEKQLEAFSSYGPQNFSALSATSAVDVVGS